MATLTITKADVVAIAPELDVVSITNADWTRTIGWAADEISSEIGNQSRLNRCGIYLTAHLMTDLLQKKQGNPGTATSGPVSSVKVGEVSKGYAVNEAWTMGGVGRAQLATTTYGREYLRLIRMFLGGGTVVAGGNGPIAVAPTTGTGWPNG